MIFSNLLQVMRAKSKRAGPYSSLICDSCLDTPRNRKVAYHLTRYSSTISPINSTPVLSGFGGSR